MINLFRELKQLRADNRRLTNENAHLKAKNAILSNPHPRDFLDAVLKGVEWYDYTELPAQEQETYKKDARRLVENPVFKNEINHLFQMLALKALTDPTTVPELRDIQQSAIAIKSIQAHLEMIAEPPKQNKPLTDPYEPI